ncbi:NAD-dependent epimerase/dehydratase family protein [Agromyces sp. CFH 90414]|uniref:NAD-dependent epimerase/dehydratase family protein n=1 Tax=Agromyces agglutinans TaxID=2662258 RepID=A0A6I2F3R3_9MICO|nr:NAD(P)-dependent oxidoreductase [Agromyces agglutinans]MRG59222.1 NAD-dependent epimerase/dehydratase family protein [Agromyces agglutinans]
MTADPRRVLVTGAGGRVGRAVLDLLAARGIAGSALVRTPADRGTAARHGADHLVVGDAGDPAAVDEAIAGADAVVHLAARPSPHEGTAVEVFGENTRATFVVLDAASRHGVGRAAIASSYAICGLPFATRPLAAPYLPFDAGIPLQPTDPYALGKRVDEATADLFARRDDLRVVSLRLPFIGSATELAGQAARFRADPAAGAPDLWSYLDTRDAARAMLAGLSPSAPGAHVVYVAAPDVLSPLDTEHLLDAYHPGVPRRRRFAGREVPIDLEPAERLLGFRAEHSWIPTS